MHAKIKRTLAILLLLLISSCAPEPVATAPPQPENTPTMTKEPTAAPTDEPTVIQWHSFFGGARQSAWDLALKDSLPSEDMPLFIRLNGTALYAEPVAIDELEQVLASQPVPEVISGFYGSAALNRHVRAGDLQPLDDLWQEQGWYDAFPASIVEVAAVDGSQYFLPHAVQWNPVWYRADLFDELGLQPPETWDELLNLCQSLRAEGLIPFTVAETGWTAPLARWFTILNLRINGAEFHQALMSGSIPFDDARVRAVFERWLELYDAQCFEDPSNNVNYGQAINRLSNGQAAMYNLGEWLFESLDSEVEQKLDFFRFPTLDPSVPNAEIAHVYGSYLPAGSPEPEAARQFLLFLSRPETQRSVVEKVGRLVPDKRLDPTILPAYQQDGLRFLEGSGQLVTLFELNAFSEGMAEAGLEAFADFYDERSADAIDQLLADLEATRQQEIAQE